MMRRREVVRKLLENRGELLVIAGLGSTAWDITAAGDSPLSFPLWGAMGQAAMIGLGLALAQPRRRVLVITGDGEMLMGLGSLATIGWTRPENLVVIVWDNAEYGTTGGQETATAHGADLEAAARAMAIPATATVRTEDELRSAIDRARREAGPWAIVAKVEESAPVAKPSLDYVFLKDRFMSAIGSDRDLDARRGGR